MKVFFHGEGIEVPCRLVSGFGKFFGLMFRGKNSENLLFEFSAPERAAIHSLFVFFPFLAIWIDDSGNVTETKVVKPFSFSYQPKAASVRLIEVPLNKTNKKIAKFFDDEEKFK